MNLFSKFILNAYFSISTKLVTQSFTNAAQERKIKPSQQSDCSYVWCTLDCCPLVSDEVSYTVAVYMSV